ncbi:15912_t:CDS:2 [Funneliformis geosporum]|nr:15912_t:CDS:2 [Funneliformis geosporum]
MEYANGDKYNLAYQLACAVSCLHDEGIVHRDLHSRNVLIHNNHIKLADFGLSKRIEEVSSKQQSKFFGIIPYIDPKRFNRQKLDKQSDVYSVGILLWEISSGYPPFYTEGELYDIDLAIRISQGLRESTIDDTPVDYAKIYTDCWENEPDNQLSRLIQNFEQMKYTRELEAIETNSLIEEDLNKIVDDIVDLIFKELNEGKAFVLGKKPVLDFLDKQIIAPFEICHWLTSNQISTNSIFLFGYFNFFGIEACKSYEKAFSLFINASEKDHILSHCYVGLCYQYGHGTTKNEKLAFKYYELAAKKGFAAGQSQIGYFYDQEIGVKINLQMAIHWYKNAGNSIAIHNLGICYGNGFGVKKDYNKAFELFKQSAKKKDSDGLAMLGYCYYNGIGTNIDKYKAFNLYNRAADLGNMIAINNHANMYENGDKIKKDLDKAIYWYEKSAQQGYLYAQNRIEELSKIKDRKKKNIIFII